jgi:hypothetical protein
VLGAGGGGAAADRHSSMMRASLVVGGDACSNHHFRAAKHRVLDTLLEHSKLRITCKIARRVMERCVGKVGAGARQRTASAP